MINPLHLREISCICVVMMVCFVSQGQNEKLVFANQSFEESKKVSATKSQLLFVTATADWCEPCKLMEQSVFVDHRVGSFYNKNFVNLKINIDKSEGPLFVLQYEVDTLPCFLFITSDGTLLYKTTGYKKAAELVAMGQKAQDPSLLDRAMHKRYLEGDRKPEFILNYLKKTSASEQIQIIHEYLADKKSWADKYSLQILFRLPDSVLVHHLPQLISEKNTFAKITGEEQFNVKLHALVEQKLYCSPNYLTIAEAQKLLTDKNIKDGSRLLANYKYYYYKQIQKDPNLYAMAVLETWKMAPQYITPSSFTDEMTTWLALNPSIPAYKDIARLVKKNKDLFSSDQVLANMVSFSKQQGYTSKAKYWNKKAEKLAKH